MAKFGNNHAGFGYKSGSFSVGLGRTSSFGSLSNSPNAQPPFGNPWGSFNVPSNYGVNIGYGSSNIGFTTGGGLSLSGGWGIGASLKMRF